MILAQNARVAYRSDVAAGGSLCALIGAADGGAKRLPRTPPRKVRTATRHQVLSRPT